MRRTHRFAATTSYSATQQMDFLRTLKENLSAVRFQEVKIFIATPADLSSFFDSIPNCRTKFDGFVKAPDARRVKTEE